MRLITIIGTDGSGKTTLSDMYADSLSADGILAGRVWLGAESQLMRPVRAALRLFWKRDRGHTQVAHVGSGGPRSYVDEIGTKNRLAERFPKLVGGYVAVAWGDYRLQSAIKFWRSRSLDVIVADRYMFDVAVNIGLTLGWPPEQVVAFCQSRLARMPLPQARFFLRVTPEVSLSRKDDIPDETYLQLRLSYYDAIAEAFGFIILDGTEPLERNLEVLRAMAAGELAKPYVHYVHANNSDVGGADRVLVSMARHSADPSGDAPAVRVSVSLREETGTVRAHASEGTPVFLHRFVRPQTSGGVLGVLRSLVLSPASLMYFIRLFRREHPDIVHVNDLYDVIPAVAARILRIPVVYHIRMIKTDRIMRGLFSWLLPRASSRSVSVSSAVRDNYFGSPESQRAAGALVIHDLGNPRLMVDIDAERSRRPPSLPGTGLLVLMVGRVDPWKGHHIFLEAVESLPTTVREGHTFAIVGGVVPGQENYFKEVEVAAKRLGVHFLGERSDVPELLTAANIAVHCSVAPDPFPGVVVESMLARTYTMGANAGGVPDLISSPDLGRLTSPGDSTELSYAMQEALELGQSLTRIGTAAREHVLRLVEPETIDRQIGLMYRELAPTAKQALTLNIERELR